MAMQLVMGKRKLITVRRVLGAGLCCAGLVLAGVLGATDGAPMPPAGPDASGSAAINVSLADGSPVPSPHAGLGDGTGSLWQSSYSRESGNS